MDTSELILRIAFSFLVLFVMTRITGRKEISQMTFFNFASAIAIGSISANLVVNANFSIQHGFIALLGWTILTLVMDLIDIKSKEGRKVVTGDPVIVIKEGKIVDKELKNQRLDLDALNSMLRQQRIFSLAEVDYAILEPNGKLSVLSRDYNLPLTKQDMNITGPQKVFPLPTEVISDGLVIKKNLEKLKLDIDWLKQQLDQAGIHSFSDVFYAQVQTDGSLFIDPQDKKNK
ncbi:YetF domain-containing protein [Salipaludibacillus aurantiacus]|uniref:Uncharacterized membrane protein YcaP, DUF421 family n=1 Tax=Salipaludibacillus aurantiacus TaxID=1601833 RepID=A0A1H9QAE4_9BACI|nr:DUF421 domain-containing protein [Salipaludibacillus aurantiacus]SER57382.1 Uncharacterized membrane protein YcaP, DUF421 family [Salipaludibacillus aurantiacus]